MPSRVLLDRIADAYAAGDLSALKTLYAEDALIFSAAAPELIMGREEVFAGGDVLNRTQLIGSIDLIPIDENAGMLRASARTADVRGGFRTFDELVWLLTFSDGLIWRQRVLESRDEATAIYQRYGLDLGLSADDASTTVFKG